MADSSDDDRPIAQIALTKISQASSSVRPAAAKAAPPAATAAIIRTAPAVKSRPSSSVSEKSTPKAGKEPSVAAAADLGDEDDVPLAQLMAKRKLDSIQRTAPPTLKKVKTETRTEPRDHGRNLREPKSKKKKNKGKAKDKQSSQRAVVVTNTAANKTIGCYESDKGKMVQAILVRWWYALTWPEPGSISRAPPGYEALDGYPGVFVGTRVR
jgi:hypothetical protein